MKICYNLKLCFFVAALALSPLSAQETEEAEVVESPAAIEQAKEDSSEELQNWLFAAGSAIAAAIGIVVVALSQGKTAHD